MPLSTGSSSSICMNDDDCAGQVLQAVRLYGKRLPCPSETRCPRDGRRLGAVFRVPDGLWAWSAGHREPSMVARRQAAAFYLDTLDECVSDTERQACYAAASRALEADVRPAVTQVSVVSADPVRYQTGFGITVIGGSGFPVTEVSCGCRQRYYLDLHSLIAQAVAATCGTGQRRTRVHVPPLAPDLPEREVRRMLESLLMLGVSRRPHEMSAVDALKGLPLWLPLLPRLLSWPASSPRPSPSS
jgi:hypothetical protein